MSVQQDSITATLMHTAPTPSVPSLVLVSQDILGMVLTVQVANHTELKLTGFLLYFYAISYHKD